MDNKWKKWDFNDEMNSNIEFNSPIPVSKKIKFLTLLIQLKRL